MEGFIGYYNINGSVKDSLYNGEYHCSLSGYQKYVKNSIRVKLNAISCCSESESEKSKEPNVQSKREK